MLMPPQPARMIINTDARIPANVLFINKPPVNVLLNTTPLTHAANCPCRCRDFSAASPADTSYQAENTYAE
jgi:hypothetical protein